LYCGRLFRRVLDVKSHAHEDLFPVIDDPSSVPKQDGSFPSTKSKESGRMDQFRRLRILSSYVEYLIISFAMTNTAKTFQQGIRALKNIRDWGKGSGKST